MMAALKESDMAQRVTPEGFTSDPFRAELICDKCGARVPYRDIERGIGTSHICTDVLEYFSPSMGRVRLRPYHSGLYVETPAELESYLSDQASCGSKLSEVLIGETAWPLLSGCFVSLQAFAPKKKWDLNATTDAELIEELLRRKTPVFAAVLSDDKLRAECNRRWGEDDCPMAKTLRHELDRARDETERVAQRAATASAAVIERDKLIEDLQRKVQPAADFSWKRAIDEIDEVIFAHAGGDTFAVHRATWLKGQLDELAELRRLKAMPCVVVPAPTIAIDTPEKLGRVLKTGRIEEVPCMVCGAPWGKQCTAECDGDSTPTPEVRPHPEASAEFKRRRTIFIERGPSAAEGAPSKKPAPKADAIDIATLADLVAADE